MKRLLPILALLLLPLVSFAQERTYSIEIDAKSLTPVQTDPISGVMIDKINPDRSQRPCARIKMHINRMSRDEIAELSVKAIGGNVEVMRQVVARQGNGLIIELTAKDPTRFYLHHPKYGDSNEVSLSLEGNKEYRLEAQLNYMHTIVVNTNVVNAEVYVDDIFKGRTGSNFSLTVEEVLPGQHKIRVQDGSLKSETAVEVSSTNIFFRVELNHASARPQYVIFEVSPKESVVTIDQKDYTPDQYGQVTVVLQNGSYNYKVAARSYHDDSGTFVVNGAKVEKRVSLKPAFGWLKVPATEALTGANIFVDGILIGTAPLTSRKIVSGEHEIRIVKALYKSLESKIVIRDNETTEYVPSLVADFATVTLSSDSGCEIYVNNERKGLSPWTGRLGSGTYIFEAQKEGYRPSSISRTIASEPATQSYTIPAPKPIMGSLNVMSSPQMAQVYVDGKLIGETPLMIDLIIGQHDISLRKGELSAKSQSITIEEGKITNLNLTLINTESPQALNKKGAELYGQKQYSEAIKYYRKAADQGYAEAQNTMGFCYKNGRGVTQDYYEAVKWFRRAAEQGFAKAQNNLGYCYEKGQGVTQDYYEAVKWYRKAAEQGFAAAQNNIGVCYHLGRGVTRDYYEAVKWYRKAVEQNYLSAQFNLGLCYEYGRGVTKDITEARRWYQKAADRGHAKAKEKLKTTLSQITSSNSSSYTSSTPKGGYKSSSYTSSTPKGGYKGNYKSNYGKKNNKKSKSWDSFNLGLSLGLGADLIGESFEFNAGLLFRMWRYNSKFNVMTGASYMRTNGCNFLNIPLVVNWNMLRSKTGAMYMGFGTEFAICFDTYSMNYSDYGGVYYEKTASADFPLVFQCGYGWRHSDFNFYLKYYTDFEMCTMGLRYSYMF